MNFDIRVVSLLTRIMEYGGFVMKPMIVCYSHTKNNERLAKRLQDGLGCEILDINEKKKRKTISILLDFMFNRSAKLTGYQFGNHNQDTLIIVAPVWGGKLASPMRVFLEKEKDKIHRYFFISLCNGGVGQKAKIAEELTTLAQREPEAVAELWINRLLPEEQQNKIKHTFHYRVNEKDLDRFEEEISEFIELVRGSGQAD
jgi:flavodoxin